MEKLKGERISLFTDCGMLCLWNYESFKNICDYFTWENELCEDKDIIRHIKNGEFVPIRLGDGAFEVEVRIFPDIALNKREEDYLLVKSRNYLLKSTGDICLSSLEDVEGRIGERTIKYDDILPGYYKVVMHLIDWTKEPGAFDENGKITKNALPDIIVTIEPTEIENMEFRTDIMTFLKEDVRK